MRIIGGTLKGRKFMPPKGFDSRPTTDYAREALFNILGHQINLFGAETLDLFCGTGAMSYELASREAKSVTAVDKNVLCLKYIKEQAGIYGANQIKTIRSEAKTFIARANLKYDLIIADPPFEMAGIPEIVSSILEKPLLKPHGLLVLEHDNSHDYSTIKGFESSRKYGNVHFSFFTLEHEE